MTSMKERLLKSDAIAQDRPQEGTFYGEHDATITNAEVVDGNFGVQLEVEYAFGSYNTRQWINLELKDEESGTEEENAKAARMNKFTFWQKDAIGAKELGFVDLADDGKLAEHVIGNKVRIEVGSFDKKDGTKGTNVKALKLIDHGTGDALDELEAQMNDEQTIAQEQQAQTVQEAADNDIPF